MAQEDEDLLLKDLCARLPYNCKVTIAKGGIDGLQWNNVTLNSYLLYQIEEEDGWEYIKPYLRPMSSMTREECNEYGDLCHVEVDTYANIYRYDTIESIDWLNAHHFDYRGLIEKGLALDAPSGMYQ